MLLQEAGSSTIVRNLAKITSKLDGYCTMGADNYRLLSLEGTKPVYA